MNILDFEPINDIICDYCVLDTVWEQKTLINVVVENENDDDKPELENFNVGKLIRPLRKKLDFLEHNRDLVEEAIRRENIDEFTEDIIKSLYFDDMFFQYFVDTGNCELGFFLISDDDRFEGCTLILSIKKDDTIEFEDIMY